MHLTSRFKCTRRDLELEAEAASVAVPQARFAIADLGDLYTESGQTLQCSFSSVSTPPIARVGAFFSILRDLQDFHSFAPLRIQNFSKNLLDFFCIFTNFLQNFG